MFITTFSNHVTTIFEPDNSGNIIAVGQVGSHLTQLVKLALHLGQIRPFQLTATAASNSSSSSSHPTAFHDDLRSAMRIAGVEGKPVSILLTARLVVML